MTPEGPCFEPWRQRQAQLVETQLEAAKHGTEQTRRATAGEFWNAMINLSIGQEETVKGAIHTP